MKKIVFRNIVLILILLSGCASEISAQCYRGDRKQHATTGTKVRRNVVATSTTQSTQPVDPNEIIGLDGYDVAGSTDTFRWVSATQTLAYTVYFENDPDLATAAAGKTMVAHSNLFNFNYAILPDIGSHILSHC